MENWLRQFFQDKILQFKSWLRIIYKYCADIIADNCDYTITLFWKYFVKMCQNELAPKVRAKTN